MAVNVVRGDAGVGGGAGCGQQCGEAERDRAEVPSAVPVWPGANMQEREVWDMYGVRFAGHPNMKRILMWEGFAGHPLRKDYKP